MTRRSQISMAKKCQHIVYIILLCCAVNCCYSQSVSVRATIDRNSILIGEHIRLQLEATVPVGLDAKWLAPDSIPPFEIIERPAIDTVLRPDKKMYTQVLTITCFDSGRWVIPVLSLDVNGKSYLTDSLPVSVAFSEFDPAQAYHDIKDILEVDNPYAALINWVLGALTLISLFALVYLLRKRSPKVNLPVTRNEFAPGPFEEAILSLEKLYNQQLPRQGMVKQYYTGLNDVLRLFISRKMNVTTMQKTSEELILQMKQMGLPHAFFIQLAQTLRMSDAVKFARYVPEMEDNELNHKHVKTAVELINEVGRIEKEGNRRL